MKPKSELMARLRARRQGEGLVRLEFWVPRDLVETIRTFVEQRISKKAALARKAKAKK